MFTSGKVTIGTIFLVPVFAFLFAFTPSADTLAQVESGDVNVSATVPGAPPVLPPTIDQPANNQTFTNKNITVSGGCIPSLIVKVFSNSIFVGSSVCSAGGVYGFSVDLFVDRNDLIARQYDSLSQPSPDSALVTAYYVPPAAAPNLPDDTAEAPEEPVADFQLVIDYDYTAHGVFANQPLRLPIHFVGGEAPYVVLVEWGDGSTNTFDRQNNNKFAAEYSYPKPGTYIVVIKVSDSSGQSAYLQFVVVVHGSIDSPVGPGVSLSLDQPVVYLILGVPFVVGIGLSIGVVFIAKWRRKKIDSQKAQQL